MEQDTEDTENGRGGRWERYAVEGTGEDTGYYCEVGYSGLDDFRVDGHWLNPPFVSLSVEASRSRYRRCHPLRLYRP